MKVLVTGGGGFLGRYIVKRLLDRAYEVSLLGRTGHGDLEAAGVCCIGGDITDYETVEKAIEGVDVVFHVAAKAGIWGNWEDFYQVNVVGTQNVIKACLDNGVSRLIYTSTPSVVFNGTSFEGADESLPYGKNWLCHYAHTKSLAEQEVLKANDDETLKTVALRPHLIWGQGDPHIVPRILDRAGKGRLRIIGDGTNLVDITHVENAAEAHLNALDALNEGRASGRAYFISQGEPVNLWNWINDLLKAMDMPQIRKRISFKMAYRMGSVLEGIWSIFPLSGEPPMTRFVATEMAKSHYFNIEAARRDLNYKPLLDTENGLDALIRHLKTRPLR